MSGGGGHLKFLHKVSTSNSFPNFEIVKVVASKNCEALRFAEEKSIPFQIVEFNNPLELSLSISQASPGLVISNVDQIIPSKVLFDVDCDFVNLHYSLLPSYKGFIGKNTLMQAIEYGSQISGATVHKISEDLDGGTPLCQVAFVLNQSLPEAQVMDNMFIAGCISLLSFISGLKSEKPRYLVNLIELKECKYLIGPLQIQAKTF